MKFEKSPDHEQFFVFSQDQNILNKWRERLANVLNQRSFHDLYKPYKKIGKGNSATVFKNKFRSIWRSDLKIKRKWLLKPLSNEAKGKESLISEINIMRQFDHPSLMKLF